MAVVRTVTINANLAWQVMETSSPHRLIAVCDQLNLAVEGSSAEDLESLIPEAIDTLLLDLFFDNEFDEYLRSRGWSVAGDMSALSDVTESDADDIRFKVPFELIAASGGSEQRPH